MKNWKIPLYKIHNDKNDLQSVTNVIKRGMDWAIGPEVEKFEKLYLIKFQYLILEKFNYFPIFVIKFN